MTSLEERFQRFRRTGDPDELAAVYDATAPRLLRTALHLCTSASEAEDVLQAAFVVAIERRDTWDETRPLLPWLVGIVANQARHLRGRAGRSPDPQRLPPAPSTDPADAATALEFTAAVDAAIDRLPEAYRAALVLHLRHGLPPADIAHALRRPPGTVRAQLTRGLEKLRTLLPASLAGSLALIVHERGLAAVREAVLGHAAATAPVVGAATTLLGILTMKKLLLAGAAAAVVLLCWSPWASAPAALARDDAPAPSPAVAAAPAASPVPVSATRSEPDAPARTLVDTAPVASNGVAAVTGPMIRGRALWGDDREPAAGITVWCRDPGDSWQSRRIETVTDSAGRFAFARATRESCLIGADRGGQVTASPQLEPTTEVELVVPAGVALGGVVLDGDRRPVQHAQIWLSDWNWLEAGAVVASTDERGRFALHHVGSKRFVGARADGYAPSRLQDVDAAADTTVDVELVLARGDAAVRGCVSALDGTAVPGAWIRIAPPGTPGGTSARGEVVRDWAPVRVRAAGDGTFAVRGLRPGPILVQVRADGMGVFTAELDLAVGATGNVTAVLEPSATVVGKVVQRDGTPVVLATVRIGDWDSFAHTHTWTGADGAFALREVTAGAPVLEVLVGDRLRCCEQVSLRPGQQLVWNPVLPDGLAIDGVVVDSAGQPLAGWQITVNRADGPTASVATDTQGHFAFADLPPEPHCVQAIAPARPAAEAPGFATFVAARLDDVMPGSPLRIEIADAKLPACSVRGRVVGQGGAPLAARVQVGLHDGTGNARTVADAATGAFALEGLLPGNYSVLVHADGCVESDFVQRELAPRQQLDLGTIELANGTVATGRMLLPAERSEPVEVGVYGPGRKWQLAEVDGAAFRTPPLGPGDYRLVVHGAGLAPTSVPFTLQPDLDPHLQVTVAAGWRCALRAELPAGAAPPHWLWATVMQGTQLLCGQGLERQQDGSYAATLWLGPGDFTVWVGSDGNRFSGQAPIAAGASGSLCVALRARD